MHHPVVTKGTNRWHQQLPLRQVHSRLSLALFRRLHVTVTDPGARGSPLLVALNSVHVTSSLGWLVLSVVVNVHSP